MKHAILLLFSVLMLAACDRVALVEDITQEQAHKIVATLHHSGITSRAEKQIGAGNKYAVEVKESLYSEAIDLITKKGLPGKPKQTFSEIVRQKGLMPNSRDIEKLRLDHALAVQLEEVLIQLPAVLDAKAVIRAHFTLDEKPAGASLVVTLRDGATMAEEELLQIVSSAVPSLTKDQIHLSLHQEESLKNADEGSIGVLNESGEVTKVPLTKFLFDWRVSEEDHYSLTLFLALALIFVGFVGAVIGYWIAYAKRPVTTRFQEEELPHLRTNVLKLDSNSSQLME